MATETRVNNEVEDSKRMITGVESRLDFAHFPLKGDEDFETRAGDCKNRKKRDPN